MSKNRKRKEQETNPVTDPNSSTDHVVFKTQDLVRLVNSDLPKRSVIVYDDAGIPKPAREWQDDNINKQRRIKETLEKLRKDNKGYLGEAPQLIPSEYGKHYESEKIIEFQSYDDIIWQRRMKETSEKLKKGKSKKRNKGDSD